MSRSTFSRRLAPQIREEATHWLIELHEDGANETVKAEFSRWLRTSPEHVRAYLRVAAFWDDADKIDGARRRNIDELLRDALAESNVVILQAPVEDACTASSPSLLPLSPQSPPRAPPPLLQPTSRWSRPRTALAAVVLLASAGLTLFAWKQWTRPPTYLTAIGEQRRLTLPDGSAVILDAQSRIEIRFDNSQRRIDLLAGQALFRVAADPAKPFIVRSDGASLQAIGTEFDVDRRHGGTVVTVLEGRVAVIPQNTVAADNATPDNAAPTAPGHTDRSAPNSAATLLLAAGDQATITKHTVVPSKLPVPGSATAWTEGLLVFESAALGDVADEFNRQNFKPLIVAADLRGLRISGIFPAKGSRLLTDFLQQRFGIVVHETDSEIRIARQ